MDAAALQIGLVLALAGSPSFSVREAIVIPPHVAAFGVCHHDPEVRYRCRNGAESVRQAAIAQLIEANRPLPWLDSLPMEYPGRCDILSGFVQTAQLLMPAYGRPGDFPQWRYATELYLYSLTADEARRVLAGMPRGGYWSNGNWIVVVPVEEVPAPAEETEE